MTGDTIIIIFALIGLCTVTFGLYYGIGVFFDRVQRWLRRRFGIDEDAPPTFLPPSPTDGSTR